jgi:putative hydrolase of the HAD superfamily
MALVPNDSSNEERSLTPRPAWLLCDYGEVLSTAQPHQDVSALAELAGREIEDFISRYWIRRLDYDRGDLTPEEYWTTVVDSPPSAEQLAALIDVDSTSWTHPNPETLAAVRDAATAGIRLAILSNAPDRPARAIESMQWLTGFERVFFSCDLRLTKPDPRIFRTVIARLDAAPHDILFVDDRIENIEAAQRAGMRTIHFTGPAALESITLLATST